MSRERGFDKWPGYDAERAEASAEKSPEKENSVDLRRESDVFQDHERLDSERDTDTALARLRDTLAEDSDGIIRLDIPGYRYDFSMNPFIGMGPNVIRTYQISRHLDVVFLHRFMFQDILACGLRSRDFVSEKDRGAFVKHIRDTGGIPLDGQEDVGYDFLAQSFSPYVTSDTTAPVFKLFHTLEPSSTETPHYPVDVWLIFDATAYDTINRGVDFRHAYRLKDGYDRRASLLGVAQIN